MNTLCVLYVASELAPLTGSGALAKEVHYLSRALAERGIDVTVAVPGHRIPDPTASGLARRLDRLAVPGSTGDASDAFESTVHEGKLADGRVKVLAVEVPEAAREGQDQGRRAFCRAAVIAAGQGNLQPDAVLAGPGTEPALAMARAHLAVEAGAERPLVTVLALRELDPGDPVIEAVPHADRIVVSSPTWAAHLQTLPEDDPLGRVMVPARDRIHGVIPGIDTVYWNPRHDHLDTSALEASKAEHKRQLKRRLGLRGGTQAPLLALIGPFDDDILTGAAAEELVLCDTLLVVLADAERDRTACQRFEHLARRGRGVLRAVSGEDELRHFEHELLCAADIALFARRHSPASLCELHCMAYGVAPVAPRTAVYADLLLDFDTRTATGSGFLFDPAKEGHLAASVDRALRAYRQPRAFSTLIERAARFDLSWRTTAVRYAELIVEALGPHHAAAAAAEDVAAASAAAAAV